SSRRSCRRCWPRSAGTTADRGRPAPAQPATVAVSPKLRSPCALRPHFCRSCVAFTQAGWPAGHCPGGWPRARYARWVSTTPPSPPVGSPAAPSGGRRVALLTLGCARNEVDSEELAGRLARDGWRVSADPDDSAAADVVLVNTCGFVDSAKQDSIETLLSAAERSEERRVGHEGRARRGTD